ncbi:protein bcn92 [Chironomus tepperi]|uniref:protein bcn92 n=1 Tax=Chironomus tepperi TaxID=113505 RepID=UPI00391F5109
MSATHQSRRLVLSLYKDLLREGSKFPAYNFRMYALRRTKDAFKDNKSLTDGDMINKSIVEAKENLELIRRQVIIGHLYQADKLIIEK